MILSPEYLPQMIVAMEHGPRVRSNLNCRDGPSGTHSGKAGPAVGKLKCSGRTTVTGDDYCGGTKVTCDYCCDGTKVKNTSSIQKNKR